MRHDPTIAAVMAVAATLAVPPSAVADEGDRRISGEIAVEVQNDHVHQTEDGSEANDLYTKIEMLTNLRIGGGLSVRTGLKLEPVQDPLPGRDRAFDDHGLFAETLQLVYEGENWLIHAGKFTPAFGLDQGLFPGLYGDTFAETYELVERVGVGAETSWAIQDTASFNLQAAIFKRDTSALGESLLTTRSRLRESAGGPGNTSGLESFNAALDVTGIAAAPGLALRASLLRQARGAGDTDDQWAYSLGGFYEIDLRDGMVLVPMIDYVHSDDAIGIQSPVSVGGATEHYLTAGLGLASGPWNGAIAGGLRWDTQPGLPDSEDGFVQVSAGYDFENGIGVQLGWLYLDQADVSIQAVGAKVSYGLEF